MAWELLKTDYVDAVFEGLRRYMVNENGDGSVSFQDVTNYTVKEGAFFGAKDANKINTAVNAILAALENGTDLYEVFTQFFEAQKELFKEESDAKQGDFEAYITELRAYMDGKWDELKTEYTGDIKYFKDVQENAFNVWFRMIQDRLTSDPAGHLQQQIGNIEELKTEEKENLTAAANDLQEQIGNLSDLETEEKSSLVKAVNSALKSIKNLLKGEVDKLVKKAGDIMTGSLTVMSEKIEERRVQLNVEKRSGWFCISNNKRLGIYDGNNNKWLIMAEPDGTTTVNGTATFASYATRDTAGNVIRDTYARKDSTLKLVETGKFTNDTITVNLKSDSTYLLVTREITVSTGKIYGYRARMICMAKDFASDTASAANLAASTNAGVTISNITYNSNQVLKRDLPHGITLKATSTYEVSYALYEFANTYGLYWEDYYDANYA